MMIKFLGLTVLFRIWRTPRVVEEHWVTGKLHHDTLMAELKSKYPEPRFSVRSQFMIEANRDRIIVFKETT